MASPNTERLRDEQRLLEQIRAASPGLRGRELKLAVLSGRRDLRPALKRLEQAGRVRFVPSCGWIEEASR